MNAPAPDDTDFALILATQNGLPLVPRPYLDIALRLGISETEVMRRLQTMLESGRIRRIGAVPNHYALGYAANGMAVWNVDDARIDDIGRKIADLPFVTHCYRRPRRLPHWPYNLFAMLHGASRDEVMKRAEEVRRLIGDACSSHDILFSTRLLKKTGLRLHARKTGTMRRPPCSA